MDYNFSDLAVRIKNVDMSTEAIKLLVAKCNDEQINNKDILISTLSSVDKNILNSQNNNMNTILQKLGETCSSSELSNFTSTINENFAIISKKDEIIKNLSIEKEVLINNQQETKHQLELLELKLKSNQGKIQTLNNKIYEMKTENTTLVHNYTSIIAELQNEKKKLIDGFESNNKLYENKFSNYQKDLEEMRKTAKQNEENNNILFKEEKKKMDILNKSIEEKEKNCLLLETEKKVLQKDLDHSKKLFNDLQAELNGLKIEYNSEVRKSKEIENELDNVNIKLNKSINEQRSLEEDFIGKAKQVTKLELSLNLKDENIRSLQEEIENYKSIADNVEESKNNEIPKDHEVKGFNPRKLFAQSRTSTMKRKIKPEKNNKIEPNKTKETIIKIEKQKKNIKQTRTTAERYSEKEDLLITKNINRVHEKNSIAGSIKSKRKLISSSQISSKSSSQSNKKGKVIAEKLLQDLDIFNEFEAIDRLGTILKPSS